MRMRLTLITLLALTLIPFTAHAGRDADMTCEEISAEIAQLNEIVTAAGAPKQRMLSRVLLQVLLLTALSGRVQALPFLSWAVSPILPLLLHPIAPNAPKRTPRTLKSACKNWLVFPKLKAANNYSFYNAPDRSATIGAFFIAD